MSIALPCEAECPALRDARAEVERLTAARDRAVRQATEDERLYWMAEARALTAEGERDGYHAEVERLRRERDGVRAEIERLQREVVCLRAVSGPGGPGGAGRV